MKFPLIDPLFEVFLNFLSSQSLHIVECLDNGLVYGSRSTVKEIDFEVYAFNGQILNIFPAPVVSDSFWSPVFDIFQTLYFNVLLLCLCTHESDSLG